MGYFLKLNNEFSVYRSKHTGAIALWQRNPVYDYDAAIEYLPDGQCLTIGKLIQWAERAGETPLQVIDSYVTVEEKAKEDERVKLLINDPTVRNSAMEGVLWATDKAPGATPGNGWGVMNGVTYFTDHMAGRSADARMFNSWLGDAGRRKDAVKAALLEMV